MQGCKIDTSLQIHNFSFKIDNLPGLCRSAIKIFGGFLFLKVEMGMVGMEDPTPSQCYGIPGR